MTTPHYADDAVTLWHGDCLEVLRALPDASVDAVVTDPPYGLEFMGKEWDAPWRDSAAKFREPTEADEGFRVTRGSLPDAYRAGAPFQSWCEQWATECLRVLKPGGHLLAFGGTRTWHRLACAVEDAGFEVRDSIAWLYGSGFPKSLDVSKAIDKAAGVEGGRGAMKRGGERLARLENGARDGGGTWGNEVNRNPYPYTYAPATDDARTWQGWGTALKPAFEPIVVARKPLASTVAANVLAHGTGALNVDGCRIGTTGGGNNCPGGDLCECVTSGISYSPTKHPVRREGDFGRWPANVILDESQAAELDRQSGTSESARTVRARAGSVLGNGETHGAFVASVDNVGGYDDAGGASRFYYVAKAPTTERPRDGDTAHPTVKPLDLMRWLVRLVTPPGGVVLEPFAGSGTTAEACVIEGFKCIAVEREADYLPLIVQRLTKPIQPDLFGGAA